ncbi:MAG: sugar transferase [Lachnospiraceae bacterium]|nr:sugar transferase [Lachnospiraceae bacterium]
MSEKQKKQALLFLLDLLYVIVIGLFFALVWYRYYAAHLWIEPFFAKGNYVMVGVYALIYLMMGRLYGAFDHRNARISEVIYSNAVGVVITHFLMYVLTCFLMRHLPPVGPILMLTAGAVAVSIPWAWLCKTYLKHAMPAEKTLLLYDNENARQNGAMIIRKMSWRFQLLAQAEVIDDCAAAIALIDELKPEAIMMCGIHSSPRNTLLKYCISRGIPVFVRPNIGDFLVNSATEMQMANLPVMLCQSANPGFLYAFVKRFMDIVLGLVGFVIFSPFMLVAAICIKAYDGGPVLYSQVRLTKDRKPFKVYKFRSMRVDAEKDGVARLATANDDRITPVGKVIRAIRVDEMPQIFCILKGDMSIVGPRPERPSIADDYEKDMPEFALRLQVKAGLTGYAQVYGKYNTEPYDKLQMDLMYISRLSLVTDLKIILMTIKILFMPESTEGIAEGKTTAQK